MKKTLNIEAVKHLIKEMDLTKECRLNEYLYPRSILYHNIRRELGWSYQSIANMFGKNHATVMNGIFKYRELTRKKDPDFAHLKEQIEIKIFDIEISDQQPYEKSLVNRVLECSDYWQMRLLQEELKKSIQVA